MTYQFEDVPKARRSAKQAEIEAKIAESIRIGDFDKQCRGEFTEFRHSDGTTITTRSQEDGTVWYRVEGREGR
jgi:hypothetical protein